MEMTETQGTVGRLCVYQNSRHAIFLTSYFMHVANDWGQHDPYLKTREETEPALSDREAQRP